MTRTQLAIAALLTLLVIASSWYFSHQDSLPLPLVTQPSGPDAFAEHIDLAILSESGQPLYRLRATAMEYFPEEDRLQLQQPLLDVTHANGSHWIVSAESGRTGSAGGQVWLTGKVNIQRLATDSYKPLQIDTRDVVVQPDAALAATEHEARVTGSGFELETRGLDADLRQNRLKLHSQVRGLLHDAG